MYKIYGNILIYIFNLIKFGFILVFLFRLLQLYLIELIQYFSVYAFLGPPGPGMRVTAWRDAKWTRFRTRVSPVQEKMDEKETCWDG